jgi:hypothetical protein
MNRTLVRSAVARVLSGHRRGPICGFETMPAAPDSASDPEIWSPALPDCPTSPEILVSSSDVRLRPTSLQELPLQHPRRVSDLWRGIAFITMDDTRRRQCGSVHLEINVGERCEGHPFEAERRLIWDVSLLLLLEADFPDEDLEQILS